MELPSDPGLVESKRVAKMAKLAVLDQKTAVDRRGARGMLDRQCAPSSIPPWPRLQRVGLDGTFDLLPQFRVVLPEVAVDSLVGEQFGLVTLGEHPIQHTLAAGH